MSSTSIAVGIGGAIACGKTTALQNAVQQLAEKHPDWGVYTLDADRLGHKIYEPGTLAYGEIVRRFGQKVVGPDGNIDRPALGALVFESENALDDLSAITWPWIRSQIEASIKILFESSDKPVTIVIVDAAVLVKAKWYDLFDSVWLLHCDLETAKARGEKRGANQEETERRWKRQDPVAVQTATLNAANIRCAVVDTSQISPEEVATILVNDLENALDRTT